MSKDIKQVVDEVCATLRLSGLELSISEVVWFYNHAVEVVKEQTTTKHAIEQLVEQYTQKEK